MKMSQFKKTYNVREILTGGKQVQCCLCKRKSTHRLLIRHKNATATHLETCYVFVKGNQIVLFNKDHFVPKSLGGANRAENMRITCKNCNENRKNKMTNFELLRALLNVPKFVSNQEKFTNYIKQQLMNGNVICPLLVLENKFK